MESVVPWGYPGAPAVQLAASRPAGAAAAAPAAAAAAAPVAAAPTGPTLVEAPRRAPGPSSPRSPSGAAALGLPAAPGRRSSAASVAANEAAPAAAAAATAARSPRRAPLASPVAVLPQRGPSRSSRRGPPGDLGQLLPEFQYTDKPSWFRRALVVLIVACVSPSLLKEDPFPPLKQIASRQSPF
ncbi:hypothetical protein, conserved [Eimeria tenella]|uniref:Uncharacterized protein n=1 Tax=Eimeria tenella TaxID=5802 RepID=U6KV98_EIMTE|nr:hypothetical protein, conserved [Eimeria tenella]CDJ40858.1 hypothetical protein, conserved [Eimeria tenella]|eukprot:XP_013231608.1 hypothetical protein, conserved [Eimeria tenella]